MVKPGARWRQITGHIHQKENGGEATEELREKPQLTGFFFWMSRNDGRTAGGTEQSSAFSLRYVTAFGSLSSAELPT